MSGGSRIDTGAAIDMTAAGLLQTPGGRRNPARGERCEFRFSGS